MQGQSTGWYRAATIIRMLRHAIVRYGVNSSGETKREAMHMWLGVDVGIDEVNILKTERHVWSILGYLKLNYPKQVRGRVKGRIQCHA